MPEYSPLTLPLQSGGVFLPHPVWKQLMPQLKDSELRVLLVVLGVTLGWKEKSGERRRRHWLSHSYLKQQTGRSGQSVSDAVDSLVAKGLISISSESGEPLMTKESRQRHHAKLFFSLAEELADGIIAANPWLGATKKFGGTAPESSLKKVEINNLISSENNKANGAVTRINRGWSKAGDIGLYRLYSSNEDESAVQGGRHS